MSNPYQPPTVDPRSPVAAADLSSLQPLRGAILTLRIIVFSLALGVIGFGVYTVVHNAGKPHTFAENLDSMSVAMLVFGVVDGLLGIVLPSMLFRFVKPNAEMSAQWAVHEPEVARVLGVQGRIQTATIVGCALFEGAAFANLYAYMVRPELLNLLMAGLMLLGILARFPLPSACERRIEDELRREKEEAGLRPG
jgi:hypothetical protein